MKKITLILVLILMVVISACSTSQEPVVEPTLVPPTPEPETKTAVVLASGEWAPFVSENLEYEGVLSRIVTEAFALDGVEVEFVYLPWTRSMESAKTGEYHGTFPWLKNEEREQDFYFSDPIAYEDIVFFYNKDTDFDWDTIEDLKEFSIGGTQGYFYGDEFTQAEENGDLTIERVSEDKLNFEKLKAGRVDIVVAEINVGYGLVEELFTPEEAAEITHHPQAVKNPDPLYLLLSKQVEGNEQLIEQFNQNLSRLIEGGQIDQFWAESPARRLEAGN